MSEVKKQQKISLSNFTGTSISIPSGMPGEAKAKAAKGFGTKMTAEMHAQRGKKVSTVKGKAGKLPELARAYEGTKTKGITKPGKGQGQETPSKRVSKVPLKPKKG